MGRGRAKAKQQKVARELKYNTHFTDLEALQRELAGSSNGPGSAYTGSDDDADADYPEYDGEDDAGQWSAPRR